MHRKTALNIGMYEEDNYYKLSGRPKSFSSSDRSRLVSYDCKIHIMVDPSHAETLPQYIHICVYNFLKRQISITF